MNKKLFLRKSHRYIGLIISIQLLAWTLGGIWFTWNDIDKIHGDHLKKPISKISQNNTLISTQTVLDKINNFSVLKSITVFELLSKPTYRIEYIDTNLKTQLQLIDAVSGKSIDEINKEQAIKIAQSHASFESEISQVERITSTDNHHEYRKKPLPAWAISFAEKGSPTFYVSTQKGELTSIRHTDWRIFDFLWMLHTMDYQSRDDFGNWLIKIFSLIALITSLSGILLFFISRKKPLK